MPQLTSNIQGLDLYLNPLIESGNDGQVIRAVNVVSSSYGAKSKRNGYGTFAAGTLPANPTDLFSWARDGEIAPFLYGAAGSILYHSVGGTGAWTVSGNGTITPGSHVGYSVLNNTLTVSQGGGTTRHSTTGTSFTDTSAAPAGPQVAQYQNRIYITGTSKTLTYSVTGDPTNWSTTGTSDSSSLTIPGMGLPNRLFKLADRLFNSKAGRNLFRWDGFSLVDTSTSMGLSSPYSYGSVENNGFWVNEKGIFTSAGDQPQLISNAISPFFRNNTGSQIAGTSFGSAPATVHYYDYFLAVGSMTDDVTFETVPNAIIKYDFQKNEFLNWSFADFPTTLHSYNDANNVPQMIFTNAGGTVFQLGTQTSDNGQPIESVLELMFDYGNPLLKKNWRILWGFFNPGCQAQIEVATSNTFIKEDKKWKSIGGAKEGVVEYRFRNGERARFLYVKITENSTNPAWTNYGIGLEASTVPAG